MSKRKLNEIEGFVTERLNDMGFDLVDIHITDGRGRESVELYCDRLDAENIRVDDCGEISRRMRHAIEAEGFFCADFSLMVSSPGLDRVMKRPEDFRKFLGREIKVFRSKTAGSGSVKGILNGYDEGKLDITVEGGSSETFNPDEYRLVRLVPDIEGYDGKGEKG